MSLKLSQLPSITADDVANTAATSILPIVATVGNTVISTYQTTLANIKSYVQGGASALTTLTVSGASTFQSDLTVVGNLIVEGNVNTIGSNNVSYTDNIIELHTMPTPADPWTSNDGKDIGIRFHYYNGADKNAALVFANDTNALEWYVQGAEGNATITGGTYGNIKTGNLLLTGALAAATLAGNGAGVTGVLTATTATYVTGLTSSNVTTALGYVPMNSNATAGSSALAQYVTGNAQGNITSVGTLSSLTVAGTLTSRDILPATNTTYDIGSSSFQYNTVYAKATSAQYADLAENYTADNHYAAGTVLIFGGEQDVTTTTLAADTRVAGVVSTDPAYLMNSGCDGVAVALRGRVPVNVVGVVKKGDLLVTSAVAGYATADNTANPNAVFAKSLVNDSATGQRTIEAVIL